jgi:hypothetical protein
VLFRLNRCIVQGGDTPTHDNYLIPSGNSLTPILKGANAMSKGMDSKKQGKKEPAKTMKEKRAAKKAKKEGKGGMR